MKINSLSKLMILVLSIQGISHAQEGQVKKDRFELSDNEAISTVVIRYKEGSGVETNNNHLLSKANKTFSKEFSVSKIDNELKQIHDAVQNNNLTMKRSFSASKEKLDALRKNGEANLLKMNKKRSLKNVKRVGGNADKLADLNLFHSLISDKPMKYGDVKGLISNLRQFDVIESVQAIPEIKLTFSNVPDLEGNQGYLDPAPGGIDARYAWTRPGGKGEGVKVVHYEEEWNFDHEDLPSMFHVNDPTVESNTWKNHGTAVLGIIGAVDNGKGVTGIANRAQIGAIEIDNFNDIESFNSIVGYGGIVVITVTSGGVPLDYYDYFFELFKTVTANGVIVVHSAGNSSKNLDDPIYEGKFDRNVRDSGVIYVGATGGNNSLSPADFTNYGSRVDVNTWGRSIFTLGSTGGKIYGNGTDDINDDYTLFSGTSGAAPIVAGAIASLQGVIMAEGHEPLNSYDMRDLITSTGVAQSEGLNKPVGKRPDLKAAIQKIYSWRPEPEPEPEPTPDDSAWLVPALNLLLD